MDQPFPTSATAAASGTQHAHPVRICSHDDYPSMLAGVAKAVAGLTGPLFTTDVDPASLWRAWLAGLPESERQPHTCHACRQFIERFGGLVSFTEDGTPASLFNDEALVKHGMYASSFWAVATLAQRGRVNGVFVSAEKQWGTESTRDKKRIGHTWHHLHATPPAHLVHRRVTQTAGQRAAELREDHGTLLRALADFKIENVRQALSLAESEALYRSEKVAGRLRWLLNLHEEREAHKGSFSNHAWLAVATAPAGFCHVRSSVVGSLLEDLEAGKPFAEVKRAFDAKMHPLQYQRPTAPPSVGNIKQAEAIVAKLGVEASLRRRYAKLDEVKALWKPAPKKELVNAGGVFAHLVPAPGGMAPLSAKGPVMTWEKFARTVLPGAESIQALVPMTGSFHALVTASDPDAPAILQWDRDGARNPVSWYTYAGVRYASQWNLSAGTWVDVPAICLMPNQWQDGFEHHGKGIIAILDGCRDTQPAGLCLFPELLKSEFHSIRSTIEAHSRTRKIEGYQEASACGLAVRAGGDRGELRVRVLSRGTVTEYGIDRWD